MPYLVHFPDGTEAIQSIRLPHLANRGTSILPGWIVSEVLANESGVGGEADFAYEVWVVAAPDAFVGHSAEIFPRRNDRPGMTPEQLLRAATNEDPPIRRRPDDT